MLDIGSPTFAFLRKCVIFCIVLSIVFCLFFSKGGKNESFSSIVAVLLFGRSRIGDRTRGSLATWGVVYCSLRHRLGFFVKKKMKSKGLRGSGFSKNQTPFIL